MKRAHLLLAALAVAFCAAWTFNALETYQKAPAHFTTLVDMQGPVALTAASVTAGTTQTQAGATALTGTINKVGVGNANDGVALPAVSTTTGATKARCVYVVNANGSLAAKIYPANGSGGTIDGGSANASAALAASARLWYCTTDGLAWTSY